MTERYITELERGHIRGQAVTYFGLALLLMGSIGKELKLITPSVGLQYIWPLPISLPSVDLGSWPVLIIDLMTLALSLFFLASLFINPWLRPAMRISRFLRFWVLVLLPVSFFIGAVKGLAILKDAPFPWFIVFTWSTILLLFGLEVHLFIEAFKKPFVK